MPHELADGAERTRARHQSTSLLLDAGVRVEVAGSGGGKERVVRHGAPEQVREA